MDHEIEIKKIALTADMEKELISLSAQWASEESCFGYQTNTEADLKRQDVFIARMGDAIIGYLLCYPYVQEKESCTVQNGSRCLEIEELYVVPKHRHQGVGRRLYHTAVDSYGETVDYVTLSTATKNYKAILHFYIDELDFTFWNARLFQKRKP